MERKTKGKTKPSFLEISSYDCNLCCCVISMNNWRYPIFRFVVLGKLCAPISIIIIIIIVFFVIIEIKDPPS